LAYEAAHHAQFHGRSQRAKLRVFDAGVAVIAVENWAGISKRRENPAPLAVRDVL
jgi:hypothetical protein